MDFFHNSWDDVLSDEFEKPYFKELMKKVDEAYKNDTCYPPQNKIFSAFSYCPYDEVKVVLLGQDPYHGYGQAHGLCFSVLPPCPPPPSLVNIFKEQVSDVGITIPNHGCLIPWAKQGILMLNTTLTVKEGCPNSHVNFGWTKFTDHVIEEVAKKKDPVVFLLWGRNARMKKKLIEKFGQHYILECAHPSPLSVYNGFWGCKHFSKTNNFLISQGKSPIDWQLRDI